jgi:DNA-binding response OmpR family regulator
VAGEPILAVTDSVDAGTHSLHAGADSVVPKPISHDELLLRIRRLLERSGHMREVLGDALVELDRRNHLVVEQGTTIDLTPTEFRLLAALMERPGAVLSHDELLEAAWGDLFRGESQVKLYVTYLRRRFAPAEVDPIETVRGVGYRYRPRQIESSVLA